MRFVRIGYPFLLSRQWLNYRLNSLNQTVQSLWQVKRSNCDLSLNAIIFYLLYTLSTEYASILSIRVAISNCLYILDYLFFSVKSYVELLTVFLSFYYTMKYYEWLKIGDLTRKEITAKVVLIVNVRILWIAQSCIILFVSRAIDEPILQS